MSATELLMAAERMAAERTASAGLTRRGRMLAPAFDLALLVAIEAALAVATLAWLMVRTGGGAQDVTVSDSTVAAALLLAGPPAWLALLARDLVAEGATPGQRAEGITIAGGIGARALRLALHPLGAAGWLWAAAVCWLAAIPAVPLLLASAGGLALLAGGVTAVLVLRSPSARGVHDLLAGTRPVSA